MDDSYRYKAHFYLGSIYYAQGNFAWAKQEFEQALEQGDPGQLASKNLYEFLKLTSQALGLQSETERYAQLVQQEAQRPKTLK